MKSVGELLLSAREKKRKTLTDIANETMLGEEALEAIESNSFSYFPNSVTALGFVTLYAQAVGVSTQTIQAVFRRDVRFEDQKSFSLLQKKFWTQKQNQSFWILGLVAVCVGFFVYIGIALTVFSSPPSLVVFEPKNEAQVQSPILVRGKTVSDALVTVDGALLPVDQDGRFVLQKELDPGEHTIVVTAQTRSGLIRRQDLHITIQE